MNTRLRYFLRSLLPVASIIFIQNAVAIFGLQVMVVVMAMNFKGSTYAEFLKGILSASSSAEFIQYCSLGASIMGIIVFGFWYRMLTTAIRMHFKTPAPPATRYSYRLGFSMMIFAMAAQYVCCYGILFLGLMFPEWADQYSKVQESQGLLGDQLSNIVMINGMFLAPMCEELCLRGVTYNYASLSMPKHSANIVQAILFAGLHGNPIQGLYTFFIGLALGKIYGETGKISLCIVLHMMFNICGLALNKYIYVGSTPVTFYVTLITAMMACYVSFGWIVNETSQPVQENENQ